MKAKKELNYYIETKEYILDLQFLFILFNQIKIIDIASPMYANITIESVQLMRLHCWKYADKNSFSTHN